MENGTFTPKIARRPATSTRSPPSVGPPTAVVVGSIVAATLAGGAPADSAESDRFAPMDGNDTLYANDTLYMADGNDSLAASDGNDSLGAPDGDDILHAADGDVLGPGA
jgi:Ca2+-binding RTX toxin-like protein